MAGSHEMVIAINLIANFNCGKSGSGLLEKNKRYQQFAYVEFTGFKASAQGYEPVVIASTISQWFEHLRDTGCCRLSLVVINEDFLCPDYVLKDLVSWGYEWHIEAQYGDYSQYWRPQLWRNKNPKPDQKKFHSYYMTFVLANPDSKPYTHPEYDIIEAHKKLEKLLVEMEKSSAAMERLQRWAEHFKVTLSYLSQKNTTLLTCDEMVPEDSMPLQNLQLLAAAYKSAVFGGNGSWNDDAGGHTLLSHELSGEIEPWIKAALNGYKSIYENNIV
jgi:hypothetical protein